MVESSCPDVIDATIAKRTRNAIGTKVVELQVDAFIRGSIDPVIADDPILVVVLRSILDAVFLTSFSSVTDKEVVSLVGRSILQSRKNSLRA